MDHYSKKVIGYRIEKSNSGKAIRFLLKEAYNLHKPKQILFLTDGGSENINKEVASFLKLNKDNITHRVAQRDVLFSNSMIEAFNKVLKHQFLYPKNISNRIALKKTMIEAIFTYNKERPQWQLGGNTPNETFNGIPSYYNSSTNGFKDQKAIRIANNKENSCRKCL